MTEKQKILEDLVTMRANVLESYPNVDEKTFSSSDQDNIECYNAGFNEGFALLKKKVINLINNEINNIVGVNIIGEKK